MSSSSIKSSLAFGVEIELLVKPKSALDAYLNTTGWDPAITFATKKDELKVANRKALRSALVQALTRYGLPAGTIPQDYQDWTVADEPSLDEFEGYWRIELVSRAMRTSDYWQEEIVNVFRVMDHHCHIALTKGCSTHVHVSPSLAADGRTYSMDNVKNILKAISYFDDAITKIMPADRKANEYAKSNVQGSEAPSEVQKAYRKVPQDTWKPLFRIYDKAINKPQVQLQISRGKYLSWNLMHLTEQCGTVEFRRPPGVRSANAAKHWISFTLGFIYETLSQDWGEIQPTKNHGTVDSLRLFVARGVNRLEPQSRNGLISERIVEDHAKPTVYSAAELEIIKRKKASKAKIPSPFTVKANSRPNTPTSSSSSPGKQSKSSWFGKK